MASKAVRLNILARLLEMCEDGFLTTKERALSMGISQRTAQRDLWDVEDMLAGVEIWRVEQGKRKTAAPEPLPIMASVEAHARPGGKTR